MPASPSSRSFFDDEFFLPAAATPKLSLESYSFILEVEPSGICLLRFWREKFVSMTLFEDLVGF